jgi:hypothetical protein
MLYLDLSLIVLDLYLMLMFLCSIKVKREIFDFLVFMPVFSLEWFLSSMLSKLFIIPNSNSKLYLYILLTVLDFV